MAEARESAAALLRDMLDARLMHRPRQFLDSAVSEIAAGTEPRRFASLISLASRHTRRQLALAPSPAECAAAAAVLPGWNPERWNLLETLRALLIASYPDPESETFVEAFDHCFRYADEGELCAFYRSLPLMPAGHRFAWRAGEGCRSNMRSVFEAVACDSPYPVTCFDDTAWNQLLIKAVFIEAPLWRVYGLDSRPSADLARMALDLADERRSAGRPVPPQLWLCLGPFVDERALRALEWELDHGDVAGRRASILALARAGALEEYERRPGSIPEELAPTVAEARAGNTGQAAFAAL